MQTLTSLNWLDIVLALIILSSAIAGLRAGFTRVVIGLVATDGGFGCWASGVTGWWAINCTRGSQRREWPTRYGFFLIFFGVALLGSLLAALLSRLLRWVGLSWFNYLLGGVAGFARGALVVAVLGKRAGGFCAFSAAGLFANSRVLPYANGVASVLGGISSAAVERFVFRNDGSLKQIWASHETARTAKARECLIIFDLDGTLIDSAEDMAIATNAHAPPFWHAAAGCQAHSFLRWQWRSDASARARWPMRAKNW